jgi:DNA-binding NarL/FixJ family response regulator
VKRLIYSKSISFQRSRDRAGTHPAFIVLMPKSFVYSFYAMPRKSNTKWTDEDDRRLLELRAAGKSERVIALALRRSPGSVGTRLSTLRARSHAGLTTEVVLELDQP